MAKNAKKTQKAKAAKAVPTTTERASRRVFPVGQCHHRDGQGQPDCEKQIVAKRANLCPDHEREWQKAARARYAARRASQGTTTQTTSGKSQKAQPAATQPQDLEAALEASLAEAPSASGPFASPELKAKADAKRAAAK